MGVRSGYGSKESPLFGILLVTFSVWLMVRFELLSGSKLIEYYGSVVGGVSAVDLAFALSAVVNVVILSMTLQRTIFHSRRGFKLQSLTGSASEIYQKTVRGLAVWFAALFVSFSFVSSFLAVEGYYVYGGVSLLTYSLSFTLSVILSRVFSKLLRAKLFSFSKKIKAYPKKTDSLVLGTVCEHGDEKNWCVIQKRAMNANILVSGSIGSGKSQAAILPFLSQLAGSLSKRPSILFIDPKRSMTEEVSEIVRSARQGSDAFEILKLSLDGEVTFNPIYREDMLKRSNFIEIAQMVKSAAVNYTGGGRSGDKFWEEAAFNLIKNSLVSAYVKSQYFTLNDLYSELVSSDSKKRSANFQQAIESSDYSEEEKSNIIFAKEYFEGEFEDLDLKIKTSILVSATTFLNQFQEARANKIFCPPKEKLSITSMDSVIDEGKCLIVDVETPGLSRSMGTFIKLHYQKSVLDRIGDKKRGVERAAVMVMDEYQDIVTVSGGSILGDEKALAKGREGNIITVAATQSYSSLSNAIGDEKAARELVQNFRSKIAFHSSDLTTINYFKELAGFKDVVRTSKTISETAQDPRKNLLLGGMDSQRGSVSESFNKSFQKESLLLGKDFSELKTFEAIGIVFDGTCSEIKRLYMKPHFLKRKNTPHKKVLNFLAGIFALLTFPCLVPTTVYALPNICSVVKTPAFSSCTSLKVKPCVCGFPVPRPCAQVDYYVPDSFIEVQTNSGDSFFKALPLAAIQLQTAKSALNNGYVSQLDRSFLHARTLAIPFSTMLMAGLPCSGLRFENYCFESMSEHVSSLWNEGSGDKLQPAFLAWSISPKLCLIKGAASGAVGSSASLPSGGAPICSVPLPRLPATPPSSHPQCTGWGQFFPRSGHVDGPATNTAALLVAARMKSIAGEVFRSTPTHTDEKWQQIYPNETECFREGESMASLEPIKGVTERGRMMGGPLKGYLFATYKKVSCCVDIPVAAEMAIYLEMVKQACQVAGA